jgi:hypothetical protein
MFDDVCSLLEEIWEELDNSGVTGIWWATIIERRRKWSQQPLLSQILMG